MVSLLEYMRLNNDVDSITKIMDIIGFEASSIYLEKILRALRLGKIQYKMLTENSQVFWIMEFFGYGLSLPFNNYETINEIIQIYYSWLCVLKPGNVLEKSTRENIETLPKPVIEEPDLFCYKIIDQYYNVFLPRSMDPSPENLGYQAMACIQILISINSLTQDVTDFNLSDDTLVSNSSVQAQDVKIPKESPHEQSSSILDNSLVKNLQVVCKGFTPELWEHILIFLLKANDVLLDNNNSNGNNTDNGPECLTLGNLVSNQSLKTLFDVWIRSGSLYFPSSVFWNTLKHFCQSCWKYRYLPLVEQWATCNLKLARTLISYNEKKDNSGEVSLVILPIHLLSQYWFKMLRTIGSPQDIIFYAWEHYQHHYQPNKTNSSQQPVQRLRGNASPNDHQSINLTLSAGDSSSTRPAAAASAILPNDSSSSDVYGVVGMSTKEIQTLLFPYYRTIINGDLGSVKSFKRFNPAYHHKSGYGQSLNRPTSYNEQHDETSIIDATQQPPETKHSDPNLSITATQEDELNLNKTLTKNQLHLISLIFLRFLTGISKVVDTFLGGTNEQLEPSEKGKQNMVNFETTDSMSHSTNLTPRHQQRFSQPTPAVLAAKSRRSPTPPLPKRKSVLPKDHLTKQHSANPISMAASSFSTYIKFTSSFSQAQTQAPIYQNVKTSLASSNNNPTVIYQGGSSQVIGNSSVRTASSAQRSCSVATYLNSGTVISSLESLSTATPTMCYQLNTASPLSTLNFKADDSVKKSTNDADVEADDTLIKKKYKVLSTINSLCKIFGDWLFACASLDTSITPFDSELFFTYGKAEASGTLCRIMAKHMPEENISPLYLSNFYRIIHYNIVGNVKSAARRALDVVQACILINSSDIFRVDLPGVSMLIPDYLTLIQLAFESSKHNLLPNNKTDFLNVSQTTVSACVIHQACINVLASIWPLTTFAPNCKVQRNFHDNDDTVDDNCANTQPINVTQEDSSENSRSLNKSDTQTYADFRKPILDLIYDGLDNEPHSQSMQSLLALVALILNDFALYQNDANCRHRGMSAHEIQSLLDLEDPPNEKSIVNNDNVDDKYLNTIIQKQSMDPSLRSYLPYSLYRQNSELLRSDATTTSVPNRSKIPREMIEKTHHAYWCFDCIFRNCSQKVLNVFDRWWFGEYGQDFNVASSALFCLSHLAKIKILIYKPVCERIIKKVCEGIIKRMCSNDEKSGNTVPALKHTKDLHTLVVDAYSTLIDWVSYHPTLLQDFSLLYTLIETCELGISGTISQFAKNGGEISGAVVYKETKVIRPISKRVSNAAENLLAVIISLNRQKLVAGDALWDTEISFEREIDTTCNLTPPTGKILANGKSTTPFSRYYAVGTNLILAFLPVPDGDGSCSKCYLVIYNTHGRYVWQIHFDPELFDKTSKMKGNMVVTPNLLLNPLLPTNPKWQAVPNAATKQRAQNYSNPNTENHINNNSSYEQFAQTFKRHLSIYDSKYYNGTLRHGKDSVIEVRHDDVDKGINLDNISPFDIFKALDDKDIRYKAPKRIEKIDLPRYYLTSMGYLRIFNIVKNRSSNSTNKFDRFPGGGCGGPYETALTYFDASLESFETVKTFKSRLSQLNMIENRPKEIIFVGYLNNKEHHQHLQHDLLDSSNALLSQFFFPRDLNERSSTGVDTISWTKYQKFICTLGNSYPLQTNNFAATCIENSDPFWKLLFFTNLTTNTAVTNNSLEKRMYDIYLQVYPKQDINLDIQNTNKRQSISSNDTIDPVPPRSRRSNSLFDDNLQSKIIFFVIWLEVWIDNTNPLMQSITNLVDKAINQLQNNITYASLEKSGSFKDVCVIFIHPLMNGLYRFTIQSSYKNRGGSVFFPAIQNMLANERLLVPIVRESIIHSSKNRKYETESFSQPDSLRRYEIQSLINNLFKPLDEYSNGLINI